MSIGENCLPDDILSRHGLKSFSTPFSSGRTNIDYVLAADQSDYVGLLDPSNCIDDVTSDGKQIKRSTLYACTPGLFASSVSKGFEFTHHDIVGNAAHRASYERKIDRWISVREEGSPVMLLYHHRHVGDLRIAEIVDRLDRLCERFRGPAIAIMMYQSICRERSDRSVIFSSLGKSVLVARFNTPAIWEGRDGNLMWARVDDDLIAEMLTEAGIFARKRLEVRDAA